MENQQHFKIIDGQFKPSEAINILYSMFDRKINFHQMESFRIQERDSGNVDYHAKRINELQETYSQLKNYITNGSNDGCDFEIFCDINISMVQK